MYASSRKTQLSRLVCSAWLAQKWVGAGKAENSWAEELIWSKPLNMNILFSLHTQFALYCFLSWLIEALFVVTSPCLYFMLCETINPKRKSLLCYPFSRRFFSPFCNLRYHIMSHPGFLFCKEKRKSFRAPWMEFHIYLSLASAWNSGVQTLAFYLQ